MNFCEDCRILKNWPDSATVSLERCEVCKAQVYCYDVPSLMLIPESERTFDQKMVLKVLMEGFKDRAESLKITTLSGNTDWGLTNGLQQAFVNRGDVVDWYGTLQVRLKMQEIYREFERTKRDRRQ